MDRLTRTITELYLKKLDEGRNFFTTQDLLEVGFPEFLVSRIRFELMRNLQDSITPPDSDWADMGTEPVRTAWTRFLEAIREEIRLPASYAGSVLESAVGDILEMMVAPRSFLPDFLFGSLNELDLETIRERSQWVVVYGYFATALPRYMEKKERDLITRDQAVRIIEMLDNRITEHYTSLNWAQLFDPWYALMGETVEPSLFARFFRDKHLEGIARHFDAETEALNRSRLIEILSQPSVDFEEQEASVTEQEDSAIDETDKSKTAEEQPGPAAAKTEKSGQEAAGKTQEATASDVVDNLASRYKKESSTTESDTLYARLGSTRQSDDESRPLYERIRPVREEDSPSAGSDIPIWKRFTELPQDDQDDADDDTEPPVRPQTRVESRREAHKAPPAKSRAESHSGVMGEEPDLILKHVQDVQKEFVAELFGGDEDAFLDAMESISSLASWKEAGTFISKEIFDRNMIDIYSDTAIVFTDRMQTYFIQKSDKTVGRE